MVNKDEYDSTEVSEAVPHSELKAQQLCPVLTSQNRKWLQTMTGS